MMIMPVPYFWSLRDAALQISVFKMDIRAFVVNMYDDAKCAYIYDNRISSFDATRFTTICPICMI